jgi:hypothetical protein
VFHILEQPVSGTDEALMHNEVRRAYLSFLTVLFTFELQNVLVSPREYFIISEINIIYLMIHELGNQGHANTLCRFVTEQAKRYDDVQVNNTVFCISLLGMILIGNVINIDAKTSI